MISRLINMRFEILERIGEGALFQVYKSRDKGSGRIVAVKMLHTAFANDLAFTQALREVMPAMTGLSHANIARLEEVDNVDGSPYLVTEFVRGINLKERIRRIAPFTISVAVDFAIAIGEALQQAHAQGFIHGDLRSQNVIVSPEGAVKVTDFGLSRALLASPEASAANLDRSASYQAPEVGGGIPVSAGSDLYSLGVILFEMLTGGLPFPGETPIAITMKHQSDPAPSPRALNPGVPKSVEGIVLKALMKRTEDRYKSAADMLNDLKSVRDALRFGKPLSWSPLDNQAQTSQAAPSAHPAPSTAPIEQARPTAPLPMASAPARAQSAAAVSEPEPTGAFRMSATSTNDDRISPYLKAALYAVVFVLIAAGIGFTAFWMATFAKPPEQKFPELKGMKIEDARRTAESANVRLLVHEEYKDNVEPGIIYQIDQQGAGRPLRPGRSVNVWVSKGSRMVYVPDLANLGKDEAEQKLKTVGLTLGAVNREYDKKIPFDSIIAQNPRARKRINRDLAVSLTISDGPKPDDTVPPNSSTDSNAGGTGSTGSTDSTPAGSFGAASRASGTETDRAGEVHSANLTKRIPRDGQGSRRVRIEFDDSRGTHTPIDEVHEEGDNVTLKVDSYGPKITVRVYYGEDTKPVSEKTMTFQKPQ